MPERAKEMIEESLRLALFVPAQRLRETNKLSESGFQILSHGRIVTKTVAADKPRTARPSGHALPQRLRLRDAEVGRERRCSAVTPPELCVTSLAPTFAGGCESGCWPLDLSES